MQDPAIVSRLQFFWHNNWPIICCNSTAPCRLLHDTQTHNKKSKNLYRDIKNNNRYLADDEFLVMLAVFHDCNPVWHGSTHKHGTIHHTTSKQVTVLKTKVKSFNDVDRKAQSIPQCFFIWSYAANFTIQTVNLEEILTRLQKEKMWNLGSLLLKGNFGTWRKIGGKVCLFYIKTHRKCGKFGLLELSFLGN